jgi:ribonuclease E
MQETETTPTTMSDQAAGLVAAARRAQDWFGEPFLHPDEDASVALAPGTARRIALDEATEELEAGRRAPSSRWRVRYGLMLGLERILSSESPTTASGTELRRHQIDALAGMLTELISANQRNADEPDGNGNGGGETEPEVEEEDDVDAGFMDEDADLDLEEGFTGEDPGAAQRYRFRHPTASGKTIAAAGFVEAARHLGILILTHRRLLVDQFRRDLTTEGYGDRFTPEILTGVEPLRDDPITIQTYAWFARHGGEISREAYQLVICDEAHTALGEKTSGAIRQFHEPLYIGMTATEQLIAKQVSDVFPASVDDLPLADAARRGLIAPLRCLRVPPVAAINSVPIVGGDFEERALAAALDHTALNLAAASLYKERFGATPGIVYAAGVEHAYNLAQEFRATGLKAMAVSGRTPPRELAETLAAYERGEINVLINAQLLAEGWNSPRATVCMHLAPTASRRVYQQRIGRIMRMHPRKEAGIVLDFVTKASPHNDRVVSLHSLLDADFYREGARVTPAPRRRSTRRARRRLSPAPWLVPVTPDVGRRLAVIQREWQRVDPKFLDTDEQRFWATIAGRQIRFDQRAEFARKFTEGRAGKAALETFLSVCAAENPNRRLRMTALADRVATPVERADFDDLVTLVTQGPPWEKDRAAGVRVLLRGIGEQKAKAPDQILGRWTWKLARAVRKTLDRKASQEFPEAKRLLGAVANSRGHRHEENVSQLMRIAQALPLPVGAALLASADGYTPRATGTLDRAREELGPIGEIAEALAECLPSPKPAVKKTRRRRRKKRGAEGQSVDATAPVDGGAESGDVDAPAGEPSPAADAERPQEVTVSRNRRRRRKQTGAAVTEATVAPTDEASAATDSGGSAEAPGEGKPTESPAGTTAPEVVSKPRRRPRTPVIHTPLAEPAPAETANDGHVPVVVVPLEAGAVVPDSGGEPAPRRRRTRKPAATGAGDAAPPVSEGDGGVKVAAGT